MMNLIFFASFNSLKTLMHSGETWTLFHDGNQYMHFLQIFASICEYPMPLWSRYAKVALIEDISGASTIVGEWRGYVGLTLIETT